MKVLIACEESQTVARGNPGGKEITMEEIKLKPCPFCGTSGQVQRSGKMWFVECANDTTSCPVNPWTGYFKNKYEAITVWNRRADNG